VLQCVAMCCSVREQERPVAKGFVMLSFDKTADNTSILTNAPLSCVVRRSLSFTVSNIVCCSVSQCGAVCCSVMQCVAVCCSVLQCVAVCCSVLQCVAGCYSSLS